MSLSRFLLTCLLFTVSFSVFSQTKDTTVFLKWKLKPNEVLSYKTIMKEIDTANHKDFSMEGLSKVMGIKGDKKHDEEVNKIYKQLNAEIQNADYVTSLTEKRKGIIDVALSAKSADTTSIKNNKNIKAKKDEKDKLSEMKLMMSKMNNGIMLRGSLYEDGTIESFYTKNDQKNLLAIMFELPGKPVKPGDTWPISVHLISMDQNFVCDSSYKKDEVTFVGIDMKEGDHIVTLKYYIAEYVIGNFNSPFSTGENVKTSMKMTYQGIAGFSLEKGKWVLYDGVMSLSSTGFMTSQTTKKFSLIGE